MLLEEKNICKLNEKESSKICLENNKLSEKILHEISRKRKVSEKKMKQFWIICIQDWGALFKREARVKQKKGTKIKYVHSLCVYVFFEKYVQLLITVCFENKLFFFNMKKWDALLPKKNFCKLVFFCLSSIFKVLKMFFCEEK